MVRISVAILLAWLPMGAAAETLGQITAFLDGDKRVWHTITMTQGGKEVATAAFAQRPAMAELTVQGHPIPEFTSKETLSIEAKFQGQYALGHEPLSVEILYTPHGLTGPFWTSRGAPVEPRLEIVEMTAWGEVGQLVAVVSGQICKRPRLFSRTDTNDCMTFSGKIETRIGAR